MRIKFLKKTTIEAYPPKDVNQELTELTFEPGEIVEVTEITYRHENETIDVALSDTRHLLSVPEDNIEIFKYQYGLLCASHGPCDAYLSPGTAQSMEIEIPKADIQHQQLGELGALFLALAGKIDYDSVCELLDGYSFTQEEVQRVSNNLRDLADTLDKK
jgi:hypothetical protein